MLEHQHVFQLPFPCVFLGKSEVGERLPP